MKKLTALLLALTLSVLLCFSAFGAGGEAADPAVTQSYLEQVWLPELMESARTMTRGSLNESAGAAFRQLAEEVAERQNEASRNLLSRRQQRFGRMTLKSGDVLYPAPGCRVTVFLGTLSGESALIDVTDGVPCRQTLTLQHLYMQSDEVSGGLTVLSEHAEVWLCGLCSLRLSDGLDSGSLADGLAAMGLFRGTTEGYNLDRGATRAQGLVMFLRLLGAEEAALKCTDPVPFTDVPAESWFFPYVSYAYKLGLTNGVSATLFNPNAPITAQHYITFLMRALHYEEGTSFTWNTVLSDCVTAGLFRQSEISYCTSGAFLRSRMVYLSWYALFCEDQTTRKLLVDCLIERGTVSAEAVCTGIAKTRSIRLA